MTRLPFSPAQRGSRTGSALILVLWCTVLLTIAVWGVVELVMLSVDHTSYAERALEARGLALTGLALGQNPQLLKNDPLLNQRPASGKEYKVTIESAGARLNLNYVLQSKHKEILTNLFTQWGIPLDQAEHISDSMYDWITPGDLKSLNGAKAADYAQENLPQRPTSKPFDSFEEVQLVMGMDALEKAKPDWKNSFTLWSEGRLDIREAPADLIAAIFSIDPQRVEMFVKSRNGPDGIAGTPDDVVIKDIKTFQSYLGLSSSQITSVGNQVDFGDPNRLIDSIGLVNGTKVDISVVTRLNTSPIQYFLWSNQ